MRKCQIKDCNNSADVGADLGFELEGRIVEIRICMEHAMMVSSAPRGSYSITGDHQIKPIPAKQIFT